MTIEKPSSQEMLDRLDHEFKHVLSRRVIADTVEAEVVTSMRLWASDCTHPVTPERLVASLFGLPDPDAGHRHAIEPKHDYAVGLSWSNPLTDADIVLTIPRGLYAEIRDHDGDGDNLIPWWYADGVSDPDTSDGALILTAINCFIWHCRDVLNEYNRRLAARPGYISKEEFKALIEDELQKLLTPL